MRILFLTSDFPSPWEPGRGPFNLALVRALRRQNHVRVVSPVSWVKQLINRKRSQASIDVEMDVFYPTYIYPPKLARWRYDWFYWISIQSVVRRLIRARTPDLVLAYWAHPDGAAAVRAAKECGAASAIIVGGSDVLLITRDRLRRAAVMEALDATDAVIAVTPHLRDAVTALGVNPRKVHVWAQGIDQCIFHPGDRVSARRRVHIVPQSRAILWVGRMEHVKGLDVLLTALPAVRSQHPDAKLFLVGDGALRHNLERQTRRLHLDDMVSFVGSMRPSQLGDWYRAADLTVLPSRSEGLPNVLRESIACGTPFVASRVGGIPSIARSGIDRLVDPRKPKALAEAIIAALSAAPVASTIAPLPTWDESAEALIKLIDRGPKFAAAAKVNHPSRGRVIDDLAEALAHSHL